MEKSVGKTILAAALALTLYLAAAVFQSDFWGDLLAPAGDLLAVGIIFYSALRSNDFRYHINWMMIGLAVSCWACADILWAVCGLIFHTNPDDNPLITALYLGTNFFILLTTGVYCAFRFRKWDSVQLILDAVAISVSILWLLWVLIFDKQYNKLGLLVKDSPLNTIGITMDMIQVIGIAVWFLSIRRGRIPLFLQVISGSVFAFTFVDLCYYYLYMKDLYMPNSLIDACYLATLLGLAVGVKMFFADSQPNFDLQNDLYSNVGYRKKGWLLLFAPVLILIFKGFDVVDLFIFALIIFLHEGFSSYIQAAIHNKTLLQREMNLNRELERGIHERTKDLEQKNRELEYASCHDALTGLYNRRYFLQATEKLINALAPNEKLILLLWNIDRFKSINDTYGHAVGDQILTVLAGRMLNCCGKTDVLARLNGDEFVLAFSGYYGYDEVEATARRIAGLCSEPIQIGQYVFQVTVSLGISIIPLDAQNSDTLLKNADIAMSYAKKQGSGKCFEFYCKVSKDIQRRHLIEALLRKADYNNEFILYYQPQFGIQDRELIGMEALLRWNCPELGFVSPAEFIPIAEEADLIISIGNWVMENAICQISEWNHTFHTSLRVGINLSPKQLDQNDIYDIFLSSLQRHRAVAGWVDIEITEGVALDREDKAAQIKKCFQDQGISISIDDFGTGYSSLGYLNMLSFDRLKIAKPLIDNVAKDESDLKIVSSIIMLAKSLGILTISEGVEDKEQFDLLLDLGCDQIQGYYLGRPMPAQSFQRAFLTPDRLRV